MPRHRRVKPAVGHVPATTRREETPELEGRHPLPEELTGRASGTSEDLATLFDDASTDHLQDGFRGGSDDDSETDVQKLDRPVVELGEEIDSEGDNEEEEVAS